MLNPNDFQVCENKECGGLLMDGPNNPCPFCGLLPKSLRKQPPPKPRILTAEEVELNPKMAYLLPIWDPEYYYYWIDERRQNVLLDLKGYEIVKDAKGKPIKWVNQDNVIEACLRKPLAEMTF